MRRIEKRAGTQYRTLVAVVWALSSFGPTACGARSEVAGAASASGASGLGGATARGGGGSVGVAPAGMIPSAAAASGSTLPPSEPPSTTESPPLTALVPIVDPPPEKTNCHVIRQQWAGTCSYALHCDSGDFENDCHLVGDKLHCSCRSPSGESISEYLLPATTPASAELSEECADSIAMCIPGQVQPAGPPSCDLGMASFKFWTCRNSYDCETPYQLSKTLQATVPSSGESIHCGDRSSFDFIVPSCTCGDTTFVALGDELGKCDEADSAVCHAPSGGEFRCSEPQKRVRTLAEDGVDSCYSIWQCGNYWPGKDPGHSALLAPSFFENTCTKVADDILSCSCSRPELTWRFYLRLELETACDSVAAWCESAPAVPIGVGEVTCRSVSSTSDPDLASAEYVCFQAIASTAVALGAAVTVQCQAGQTGWDCQCGTASAQKALPGITANTAQAALDAAAQECPRWLTLVTNRDLDGDRAQVPDFAIRSTPRSNAGP